MPCNRNEAVPSSREGQADVYLRDLRVAITGARGGYARTLIAQLIHTPGQVPVIFVDPDVDGVLNLLKELRVPEEKFAASDTPVRTATLVRQGKIAIVPDLESIAWSEVDVLVEATGQVKAGVAYATAAIDSGVNVVMVSKEVETVAGVELSHRANDAGVRYLPALGDQPANLLRLLDWIEFLGFEVVACGKSSEYDLCFDPIRELIWQRDEKYKAPEIAKLLSLEENVADTLKKRAASVAQIKRASAADSCEMTVVSQYSGYIADIETMHYPVCRPSELADIYIPKKDGGILEHEGVVDVFSMLRLPGEASFAGGVFVVVKTHDPDTWEVLREKGHIVSHNGDYAAICVPFHLMGVETPITIAVAGGAKSPYVPLERESSKCTILAARATHDIAAGTKLTVEGHHHEIAGLAPVMLTATQHEQDICEFYSLDGAILGKLIKAGAVIKSEDIA